MSMNASGSRHTMSKEKDKDKDKDKAIRSERVLVHVRIRPFTEDELIHDKTSPIEAVDLINNAMTIKKEYDKKHFSYDTIFPVNSRQNEIFDQTAKSVIDSVLDGYNGTIFAYGQTGTGKTYTMVGEFEDNAIKGIIPRAFDYIFDKIKQSKEHNEKYTISIAFIQIYLESIEDLLDTNNQVKIREDPDTGVYLENIEWVKVTTTAQCADTFYRGEKNRVTACTKMNAHSSRSHALLICKIEKSFCDESSQDHVMTKSMLYLVDLAGSERVTKTKAKEMRLEEARKINYSLLVLGNCIQSLTDPKSNHVSYRDSKLTRILQESLGGNAKTSLIVTISPSNYNAEETISSLYFGVRAMKVQNKPMINKTEDYKAQCYKLQDDYDKLMDSYSALKIDYDKVVDQNNKLLSSETFVDLQRKSLKSNLSKDKGGSMTDKEIEEMKAKFAEELKQLEKYYEELIEHKTKEFDETMKKYDDIVLRKENETDILKNSNNELTSKIELLNENVTDLEKQNDGLQKSVNDVLIEKDTLNNTILSLQNDKAKMDSYTQELRTELKNTKDVIELTEQRRNNVKFAQTQTDLITDKNLKETLTKLKIDCNNGASYIDIITNLLKVREAFEAENTTNAMKIKKLTSTIEIIRKSYEEKDAQNEKTIDQMKNTINSMNEDRSKVEMNKNEVIMKNDQEIKQYKFTIKEMENIQLSNKREMNEFQALKKSFEKKMYDIENNNKLLTLNTQAALNDNKVLQNTISFHEKSMNKLLNQITNDLTVYTSYKREIKKFESIFECDLLNTTHNNKSFETFTTKLKNELQKVKTMLNNPSPTVLSTSETTYEAKEVVEKLTESLNEVNIYSMSFINAYAKLASIFYTEFKQSNKPKEEANTELIALEKDISKKNEAYIKNSLLLIVKKSIEKYGKLCYKENVDDLVTKVNALTNQLDKLQSDELLKHVSGLFGELIIRISSSKDERELEIQNLTQKIIFLLRELEIYKKKLTPSNSNDALMNHISLKNEEISKMNMILEENMTKIKVLSCQNSLLKSKNKTNGEKEVFRSISAEPIEKLETKVNDYKSEIGQISVKINAVRDQQITEKIDKDIKHKTDYYKERLLKNIKKK